MSREALVLLVCCCDFRDGAERLISSKSLRNAVIRAFPGLFRILRMCAPRRAAAVVRPRGREKSADRRRRILISRLLIIRASVPRWKSPFPAYFKGFPAVSPLIPPYPAFLKYPVSPQYKIVAPRCPPSGRVKRESGENPERCSHCVRERTCKGSAGPARWPVCASLPLGNREGQGREERSQETCLGVESQIRCPRVGLPASLYGLPLWKTTFDTARENGCASAAVFIFFRTF